jgi:hypothetical protein
MASLRSSLHFLSWSYGFDEFCASLCSDGNPIRRLRAIPLAKSQSIRPRMMDGFKSGRTSVLSLLARMF